MIFSMIVIIISIVTKKLWAWQDSVYIWTGRILSEGSNLFLPFQTNWLIIIFIVIIAQY